MYTFIFYGLFIPESVTENDITFIPSIIIIMLPTDTEDYTAFQFVPLTFIEGSVSGNEQCYTVAIMDDNILENNETFSVTLSSNEPAFNLTQATVTINHDPADCEYMICTK